LGTISGAALYLERDRREYWNESRIGKEYARQI
jgi:hypothetical protein